MRLLRVAVVAIGLGALVPAQPAAAHAAFVRSDPADGAVLHDAPSTATLRFDEAVLLGASTVRLSMLGTGETVGLSLAQPDGKTTITAALPRLGRGGYVLRYTVVDPADLHRSVGSISFGVGVAAPPAVDAEQIGSSTISTSTRFVGGVGLIAGVGSATLLLLRRRAPALDPVRRRAARIGVVAAVVVASSWVAALLLDAADVGFAKVSWFELLSESGPGHRVIVGLQLAVAVWWASRWLRSVSTDDAVRVVLRTIPVLWCGFVMIASLGGHGDRTGATALTAVARGVHLASLGMWLGAVAIAWTITRGADRGGGDVDRRDLWSAVSRVAVLGLAFTGASGFVLTGRMVSTVTALLSTTYGQVLLLKAACLAVLGAAGWFATRRVRSGGSPRGRVLGLELGVACVAAAAAAVLVGIAPPRGERFEPLAAPVPQIVTADAADLTVTASLEPGRVGLNLVRVGVLDTRRPAPPAAQAVVLRVLDGGGSLVQELRGAPSGGTVEWDDLDLPAAGAYQIVVAVDRPALPVPAVSGAWTASVAPVPRAATVVSNRSLWPMTAVVAGLWICGVVAVDRVIVALTRRSRTDGRDRRMRLLRRIPAPAAD